jgi:adenine/guanine phosphoribosyltransferase-like PRPP-binding protein
VPVHDGEDRRFLERLVVAGADQPVRASEFAPWVTNPVWTAHRLRRQLDDSKEIWSRVLPDLGRLGYQLDPELADVDLWRFRDLVERADVARRLFGEPSQVENDLLIAAEKIWQASEEESYLDPDPLATETHDQAGTPRSYLTAARDALWNERIVALERWVEVRQYLKDPGDNIAQAVYTWRGWLVRGKTYFSSSIRDRLNKLIDAASDASLARPSAIALRVLWDDFERLSDKVATEIRSTRSRPDAVIGIGRGGFPLAVRLSHMLDIAAFGVVLDHKTNAGRRRQREPNDDPSPGDLEIALPITGHHFLLVDDVITRGEYITFIKTAIIGRLGGDDSEPTFSYAALLVDERAVKNADVLARDLENGRVFAGDHQFESEANWAILPWERP